MEGKPAVSVEAPYVCDVGYPFKSADDPSTPENDMELYDVLWGGSSDGTTFIYSQLTNIEKDLGDLQVGWRNYLYILYTKLIGVSPLAYLLAFFHA